MRAPWTNKTGLAKAATIFACIFGISTGLCGVTGIAGMASYNHESTMAVMGAIGMVELAAMAMSLAGLIAVAMIWLVREFMHLIRR